MRHLHICLHWNSLMVNLRHTQHILHRSKSLDQHKFFTTGLSRWWCSIPTALAWLAIVRECARLVSIVVKVSASCQLCCCWSSWGCAKPWLGCGDSLRCCRCTFACCTTLTLVGQNMREHRRQVWQGKAGGEEGGWRGGGRVQIHCRK